MGCGGVTFAMKFWITFLEMFGVTFAHESVTSTIVLPFHNSHQISWKEVWFVTQFNAPI